MTRSELYGRSVDMRNPRWRQLKLRRLQIARFQCERCGQKMVGKSPRAALRQFDLHHANRYGRLGVESVDEVRILCRRCHDALHLSAV